MAMNRSPGMPHQTGLLTDLRQRASRWTRWAQAPSPTLLAIATILFFAFVIALLVGAVVQRGVNRDENIFVTGGVLVAKSLLPYRDFHYFHMPYQAFIYAVAFGLTDYLLLTARLISTLGALAILVVVFLTARRLFSRSPAGTRFLIAAGAVLLIATNPVFIYTQGIARNHELSVLAALLAFLCHRRGVQEEEGSRWTFLSGILMGIATGIRVSFAFAVPPFLLFIIWYRGRTNPQRTYRLLVSFLVGGALALLPVLLMGALKPGQFVFDNYEFFRINEAASRLSGYTKTMSAGSKLAYFVTEVAGPPGTLALGVAYLICGFLLPRKPGGRLHPGVAFTALLLPFLFLAVNIKAPIFYQYFYPLVPFLVLGVLYGIASIDSKGRKILGLCVFSLAIIVSSLYGLPRYRSGVGTLRRAPDGWVPVRVHRVGGEMSTLLGGGRVLTIVPIYPLEGGLDVYIEFDQGVFAWRLADLLTDDRRRELKIVGPADLEDFLKTQPPRGILVGVELEAWERPMREYAITHGFRLEKLSNGSELWVLAR